MMSQIRMYHHCEENMDVAKGLLISQLFIILDSPGLGQETLEGRKTEMPIKHLEKNLSDLGMKGREENSTEPEIEYGEVKKMKE